MGRAMMGPQATGGFQAPEPYVPESAKAAGALSEAGLSPPVINALQQATTYNLPGTIGSSIPVPPVPRGGAFGPIPRPGLEGPDVDFSQYEAGFREYQKQNPLGPGPVGMAAIQLPGGLRLGDTGESKQFYDYMQSIGDNSYNQYTSGSLVTGFDTPTLSLIHI